ncbi:MAG: glycoside hydrolase [Acidobacteria bacterium]|nr:glycoside hydrolase [Acidobacteriota bacterium]
MHWRAIGPTRAGRTRALDGVASQPNVFYIGFDNGGVWRSTDYGSTWAPLFDHQPTSSIGAIAVAASDPNVIYVGSGGGIIRPDLSTGDGMYKSTDAGATWTHLGLRDSQMIADVVVDPTNPDRLFVAVLGHPYGPNPERGIFRSLDGGRSFEKVLYRDEYTSGNDLIMDPADPNTIYATLWPQQQSFREGSAFGGAGTGIFKSTDGGTTWQPLSEGLPNVIQANLALAPSNSKVLYAMVAGTPRGAEPASTTGVVGLYKSTDAGAHWTPVNVPAGAMGTATPHVDTRPLARIGGGDLPTLTVDPKDENIVYSATVVMWRSDDGGVHWTAIRGAYGGDDYQKIWINPNDPKIILAVSDQGAVISANRGESWSNWYTQPTAAMYHVTADNDFPYRLCGGQQDSGSACVKSRSDDGMITFHDWHPVMIQEYGIAAPDPRDPDVVFGSSRSDVTRYDRKTGQTASVGPDMGPRGGPFNRNVRTMPIQWSPLDPDLLFYTSNAVWKTRDRGHSWTRISPDLARSTWAVPESAGKYAGSVSVDAQGTITALSPSPMDVNVIWAGTDDGNIQVTMDGGAHWANVTPPQIKPWTRIFNIEAGHFNKGTAYAAANTMRIDDMNPHFWRTKDGGKTWTEINTGLAPGAVANSIREDPRKPGLLYAATETEVWFSVDDGGHWQSLRMNMPAVSVRDIQVKDDATCLCSDLVAGTHGRGFWILDNVTPLRQLADAEAATSAFLFAPATAVRVRFGTNDPTEWTPELPHGDNPLPGGLIDYYLAADVTGPVTLEILDARGTVVRSLSSDDRVLVPDPALDPAGYDRICQKDPTAPNCRVPLYWPAPQMVLSTTKGMHRFSWDLHFDPIGDEPREGGGATGAVPGRTYPSVQAPWAPAGQYQVLLTVAGQQYTRPLTLRLDPRVKTPAADLARLATLSREMYDGAVAANAAYLEARALVARTGAAASGDAAALRTEVEALAPEPRPAPLRFGPAPPAGPPTLDGVSRSLMAAALSMQDADVAPTARQVAACEAARAEFKNVMGRWSVLRTRGGGR